MTPDQIHIIMIPASELAALRSQLLELLILVKQQRHPQSSVTSVKYITALEFMSALRIGRTKFDQLVASNKIKTIKKCRKIYVPASEIERYFTSQ